MLEPRKAHCQGPGCVYGEFISRQMPSPDASSYDDSNAPIGKSGAFLVISDAARSREAFTSKR